jgi:plasmid maintenance system antidote protein VapI
MKKPTTKRPASFSETSRLFRKRERFLLSKEIAKPRDISERKLNLQVEAVKEEIEQFVHGSTFSGSVEEKINNYKHYIENAISKDDVSASGWELYGHIRFLYGDKSPEDLRAAARAYRKSIQLDDTKPRPKLLLEEVTQQLRRAGRRGVQHQTILPADEKSVIENQPYGKQRAAEMSEKVREAIEKGEHVGAFIQRELIGPSGQTLEFIAEKLGVHWTSISYMRKGRYKLSPELAANLSHYFNEKYTTQELLTIQAVHDAKKADQQLQAQLASLPQKDEPTPA